MEGPQKYPRMWSKCPSLCVHKHAVLTIGFACASQRKKRAGQYMLHVLFCLSHHLHCLVIYLFMLKPTSMPSGMASVCISGIVPTFYTPGAQLSLRLLVIPITVNRSCTCPPGRQRPSTSWCRVCWRAEN